MINLGIVEDETSVRENLTLFLNAQPEMSVLKSAGSVEDFLEETNPRDQEMNMVLLDINLPGMSGLEGIRHIRSLYPKVDVLILSAYDDSDRIFKALCAGAVSYISKRSDLFKIKEAITSVHHGGAYMSPSIARKVISHFAPRESDSDYKLTGRQEQIVQGLVDGLSYKMIADKYLISVETVRDHIKKIYKKLEVNSRAEVVRKRLDGEIQQFHRMMALTRGMMEVTYDKVMTWAFRQWYIGAILLSLMAVTLPCTAQNGILQSQYYSLNDGLSDRLVKDILFSSRGLVWIATENGLNRFDGYDFIIFDDKANREPRFQISSSNIEELSEDRFGNIIIEYNTTAFFDIFNPHSGEIDKIMLFPETGISNLPRKIHVDRRGEVYAIAANDHHTTVYEYTYQEEMPFRELFSVSRNGSGAPFSIELLHTENGFFFINDSEMGLYLFDPGGELMRTFKPEDFDAQNQNFLYPRKTYFLHQDKESRIWLAFNGVPGVYLFDATELVFAKVKQLSVDNLYPYLWEDQKGNLLLPQTNTSGFYPPIIQINCVTNSNKFLDFSNLLSIGNYLLCAESRDFFKTIFFGIDTGLKVVQNNRTKVKTFLAKNLSADRRGLVMRGITGDGNGHVYFAEESDYWYRLDLENDVLDTMMMADYDTGLQVDFDCALGLYMDPAGTLWGASCKNNVGQIFAYDTANCMVRTILYEDRILAFTVDSAGIFWLGTEPSSGQGQLVYYNPTTGSFTHFVDQEGKNPLGDATPRFLLEGKDKMLWVGTEEGLYKIDREKATSYLYQTDSIPGKGLSHNTIYAIYEDEKGNIWLGTKNGLNILNPKTGSVKVYDRRDGLASNTVFGILPDGNGKYWISTYNGLSYFEPDNKKFPFRSFYQADGFSHDEFNRFSYYKDENGRCYLGSVNGVNAFYPEDILIDKEIAKVILTKITRYNSSQERVITQETGLDQLDELVIEPNDTYFTLDFTLPVYRRSTRNQFQYYLEGYDKEWINNNNNHSIRFNRLPVGNYTLHVVGADPNGNLSNEPYYLKIRVEQVFFKKSWFIMLTLILIGLALVLFNQYQLDQKLKVERLRTKISSDLHDELSGLLTGIAMQTDIMASIVTDANNRERLKKIGIDSRTALSKMSDVIWSVDSRKDRVEDLIIRMQEHADEILLPMGMRYDIIVDKIDRQQRMPVDVRQDLYFIFKEAINNVGKHSEATDVKVILRNSGQHFDMIIQDNGKGSNGPKATPKGGQGLSNLRMRAERLNAQLKLINENGFTVSLKMRRFLKPQARFLAQKWCSKSGFCSTPTPLPHVYGVFQFGCIPYLCTIRMNK